MLPASPHADVVRPDYAPCGAYGRSDVRALLETAAIDGLQLERAVLDVEVVGQAAAQRVEHPRRDGVLVDHDVRGHHVHARGDRPCVQVVAVDDPGRIED